VSRLPPRFADAWRRIRSVARKEVLHLRRDRLTLGFLVGVPLVQLVMFGYAINQDVRDVPTAVLDRSRSEASRRLVGRLEATQTFRVTAAVNTEVEGRRLLRRGAVQALVVIPGDFDRHLARGRGAEASILVDATDPLLARAARGSAEGLARSLEERLDELRGGTFETRPDLVRERPVTLAVHTLYNPELRTPVFVVPGLLGVILTTTMILVTAISLVRERERGTFEFLIGTPVRRLELMAGKLLPYVVIGAAQVAIVLAAGLLLFAVPVKGSLVGLAVASLLFIAANLTLGLLISASVETQAQATHVSFFFFLPSVLLSGFMFPFDSMPAPARWLGELLPLTHYNRICRAVLLRGAPVWELPGELAVLAVFFLVGLAAATRRFRKRLD
jgi:ABC-2 type transport system permease protein